MEIKKAEIKDLDIVIKLKMDMFKEVGSIVLLQDNAEKHIYEKYRILSVSDVYSLETRRSRQHTLYGR